MVVRDIGRVAISDALVEQGFQATDAFGQFVTYERANDPLKLHVGPDGSFSAFNGDDEVVAEGKGAHDLYAILVSKAPRTLRAVPPRRRARWGTV